MAGAGENDRDVGTAPLSFWRTAGPQMVAVGLVSANPLIDRAFAAGLEVGSVTTLELAERVFFGGFTLLIAAVALVSQVIWSYVGRESLVELRRDYWRTQKRAAVLTAGVALIAIVVILAGGNNLAAALHIEDETTFTASTVIYAAALPFALSQELGVRLLVSQKRTRLLPAFAVLSLSVNVLADYLGVRWFGVAGIAAASLLVRMCASGVYVWAARRLLSSTGPK